MNNWEYMQRTVKAMTALARGEHYVCDGGEYRLGVNGLENCPVWCSKGNITLPERKQRQLFPDHFGMTWEEFKELYLSAIEKGPRRGRRR